MKKHLLLLGLIGAISMNVHSMEVAPKFNPQKFIQDHQLQDSNFKNFLNKFLADPIAKQVFVENEKLAAVHHRCIEWILEKDIIQQKIVPLLPLYGSTIDNISEEVWQIILENDSKNIETIFNNTFKDMFRKEEKYKKHLQTKKAFQIINDFYPESVQEFVRKTYFAIPQRRQTVDKQLLGKLAQKYNAQIRISTANCIVTFSQFPQYVVKINFRRWPSIYQNLTRIVNHDKIRKVVKAYNLNHIHPLNAWLLHIPGQPAQLHDDNYVVIEERVANLPSEQENKALIKMFFGNKKEGYTDFYNQVKKVIEEVGLWDLIGANGSNMYVIEKNGEFKVVFVDTEWASKQGPPYDPDYSDDNFPEMSPNQKQLCVSSGISGLNKLANE